MTHPARERRIEMVAKTETKRSRLFLAAGACLLAGLSSEGSMAGAQDTRPPVAALKNEQRVPSVAPAHSQSLAEAVVRWRTENPSTGPGTPLVAEATNLLTGVGHAKDTLSAFRTDRGDVCFEVRAAGSCGRVDTPTGIIFAILYTRAGGTRLYGVAADKVNRIEVRIDGVGREMLLRNNGLYYELPEGLGSGDIDAVISFLHDGSAHSFPLPGRQQSSR